MPLAHRLANTGTLQTNTYFNEYTQGYWSNYFDGSVTTNSLTYPSGTSLAFGAGDFTVEAWVYSTNTITNNKVMDTRTSGVAGWYFGFGMTISGYLGFSNNGTNFEANAGTVANTWYHIAYTRSGTTGKLFCNGVLVGTFTDSTTYTTSTTATIGNRYAATAGYQWGGYISNLRVVKGTAVYTANFTPATTPLTAITNTSLLTCQSSYFKDNSINNFTITVNGTVTANTVSPFPKTPSFTANNIIGQLDEYTLSPLNPNNQCDPYFNQVSLLLSGDGINGSNNNTFLDSSTNNFTVTRNGNTTQGTNTPFSQAAGYWSNYFNGTTDYLSSPANTATTIGTGDFTFESWIYSNNFTTTYAPIFTQYDNSTNGGLWIGKNGSNFVLRAAGVADQLQYATMPTTNTWTHIAITRSGSTVTLFYNGISVATATSSYNFINVKNNIGSDGATSASYFTGYISNLRLVKGTVVYTANFTPPTTPLTAISGTQLLTCQSNYFKDNSSNNFTLTATGTPSVEPFSPFAPTSAYSTSVNGGSMYFDGTGDYLTTPNSANNAAGTGDFTFECWLNLNSVSGTQAFFNYSSYVWGILIRTSGTSLDIYVVSTNVFTLSNFFTVGQWTHVVLVRTSGVLKVFKNGVQIGSNVASTSNIIGTAGSTGIMTGGSDHTSGGENLNGYISNSRYVVGTAVYTTTFTPPTAPLTAITNTQLLLSGTNAGIFDNAIKNNLETVGNAQVSTSVVKYGTGSMSFDGTGDYIFHPTSSSAGFGTGNFTIEMWINFNSVASSQLILGDYAASSNYGIALWTTSSGTLNYYFGSTGNSWNIASAVLIGNISINTWYHVAVVRNGSVFTPYFNGVAGTTSTSALSLFNATTAPIYIGGNTAGVNFNGYIDDLRITKGIARYTANFTPPTQAFYNKGGISNINSSKVLSLSNTGIITVNGQFDEYSINVPPSIQYLIVAGGGGSSSFAGGGGGGGLLEGTLTNVVKGVPYTITVGGGGPGSSVTGGLGANGINSAFSTVTTIGGGGGASRNGSGGVSGGSGGSGGGGSPADGSPIGYGGLGTSGQGYAGGQGGSFGWGGGGGGGAGEAGKNAVTAVAGNGANGAISLITGSSTYYAGGGGGSSYSGNPFGTGGLGGGGAGRSQIGGSFAGVPGTTNTGGGGGGGDYGGYAGGNGGSGIVIISYSTAFGLATTTGSPTYTSAGGNYIYSFTGTGTIKF